MLDRLKSFVCGLALIALLGLGCLAAAHAWELTARWIGEAELRNWRQKVLEEQPPDQLDVSHHSKICAIGTGHQ